MRLNLFLRGIDLLDIEFHAGSKGLSLDVSVFQPRQSEPVKPVQTTADLSGTAGGDYERVGGPVWSEDHPAVVHGFGFRGRT